MKIHAYNIPYSVTDSFSKLVIDYVNQSDNLKLFITEFSSKESIQNQIAKKKEQVVNRTLLYRVLKLQYSSIGISEEVKHNIEDLKKENTFSVCTAHQPNIFTGYLYFIYKIIHAINLAKECNKLYPSYSFVPVYYMGSEDNDIDEIGHFHYSNKTYNWNTNRKGACGRMQTWELMEIVTEVNNTLNDTIEDEAFLITLLKEAYNGENTLAQATRIIVNTLFGKYGLVVIDGDDPELKRSFIPVIRNEILNMDTQSLVMETANKLSSEYKVQANPRPINLFYLKDDLRERIEKVDKKWHVINTEISFTQTEIENEIENFPERFSPNVILRPLYQENILPNVAFIGGGGELAYWLELKSLFEKHGIAYPIIFLRNSVLWINEKTNAVMEKISLDMEDVFSPKEKIFKKLIRDHETMKALQTITDALDKNYQSIISLGSTLSPSMEKSMEAHTTKAKRIEDRIILKFNGQLKKKEEIILQRIENIKQQIAPNGTLQERYDNFLAIYKSFGLTMFDILIEHQKAFGNEFLILKMK